MSTDAVSAPILEPAPVPAQSPTTGDGDHDEPVLGQIECAKPTFLHSPPDSNNAPKSISSDSELSDLDDDAVEPPQKQQDGLPAEDDIGEVLPDHWSGTVPVFKPTMHQFKDFKLFMTKVDQYGMKSGIVKIIPPSEWKESLPRLDDLVKQIRVREPIKQDIMGSNGTYRQVNILHQRSYNLPQWRQLCDQSEHQPPARRGERRANAEKSKPRAPPRTRAAASATPVGPKKRGRGRPPRAKAKVQEEEEAQEEAKEEKRPITPVSPKLDAEPEIKKEEVVDSVEDPGIDVDEEEDAPPAVGRMGRMGGARPGKPKTQSVSARRKYSKREGSAMIDEEAFKGFDYQMDVSDYTPERCEELERIYWKTLTYAPPLYGADLMGTLFDESTEIWNLNKLPNLLDVLGTKVPGVNTAYLYLGMWKATFAWHLEDVDLYSINYLHFGAPKQWYSISQADARRFEAAMKNIWPTDAKACDQFLRHKGFLISPSHLKQHYNITVNKCVSYPGEFVVTYPYGYHSGYNLGYNCAEAVNFALDSWLPMGKIAKRCECAQAQDSVWIDVYDIERKLRGEETEYEETDDEEEEDEDDDETMEDASGLPSPPNSSTIVIKPGRKRKRAAGNKERKTKVKRIRLKVRTRAEPVCCLCPNDVPGAQILPTDDGRKAHQMCALYLPETYIDTIDGKEIVANVAKINKERLDLKCLYCRSKKGACFQCSQKKCARAYHATCAAAAGVFVEEAEVPVFGEDGTEYKEQAFEFSCRFHRTKRDKKFDGEILEDDQRIREAAAALKKGEICQMQYYKGDIFAGVVVENREDEQTLLLDVLPNGDRQEVEWKWLLLPDPSDYHLPKASAKAIPLPPSKKAKDQLNAKRPTDEIPRKDASFVEGFTWAEFHPFDKCANSSQVKVDLSKDNQIWHYLGKTSTEAKAQYTEDPASQRHNPKSNYLDTIPKPPRPTQANTPQRRQTTMPPQPSPMHTLSVALQSGIKPEKPYVYKPRKPLEPSYTKSGSFTTQSFIPKPSPSPSPMVQQLHFGSDPRYATANAQFAQQRFTPSVNQSYNLHHSPAGSTQFATPNTTQRPSPYSSPPAPSVSAARPAQQVWATPSQSPRPQTTPRTSQGSVQHNHRRYSVAPAPSVAMKYAFFQVHHNRESKTYRTPYAPWGGFTNGYEGNLRAHLMRTSPEAFFRGSRQNSAGATPSSSPSARTQASAYGSPYYNTFTRTVPQSSTSVDGGKTALSSSYTPSPSQTMHDPAKYSSSTKPPVPAPNGSPAGVNGYSSEWNAQQTKTTHFHPAIRPQYGAWTSQPQPSWQPSGQFAQQEKQTQTAQAKAPQPALTKPQAAPKSAPAKVQYKIPEKQTPVPLPAKYLAAMGKLPATTTLSQASPQSNGTASQDTTNPSPNSGPSANLTRTTPANSTQVSSTQVSPPLQAPTASAGSSMQATASVPWTHAPVPQTPVPVPTQRNPFTNPSSIPGLPQVSFQNQSHAVMPQSSQRPPQTKSQQGPEHHSLNPAEILAQIATQPRMNSLTPTAPHPFLPSPAPQQSPLAQNSQTQQVNRGMMYQPANQHQAYAPPSVQCQPWHHQHHQHLQNAAPSFYAPYAPESEEPLPEVPADSTALVERMMQNLRRAAYQG